MRKATKSQGALLESPGSFRPGLGPGVGCQGLPGSRIGRAGGWYARRMGWMSYNTKQGIGAIRLAVEGGSDDAARVRIIREILARMPASDDIASTSLLMEALKRSGVELRLGEPGRPGEPLQDTPKEPAQYTPKFAHR
jgi:hypothetical protein